ncbi:MerR family transcriptional regulator [Embleya sp. NPDC005575]|uniref:MerR family transcriptional regulator n=1 Tax=Embleya sp. NPDC005575 TaxID=3156892 RepID=UPI0033B4C462
MREEELLTIGRFARLCRLSVKQLRHYDDVGLLRPVRVDRATGYRYYATDQARDALTVALLREIDVPPAVIAETLAARAPTARWCCGPSGTGRPSGSRAIANGCTCWTDWRRTARATTR